jgi:beta-galactosidase
VKLALQGEDAKDKALLPSLKLDYLIPGEMKVLPCEIIPPESLPSGHYQFVMDVHVGNELRSSNDYKLYLLNGKDIKPGGKAFNTKIALYCPGEGSELPEILKSLNVQYVKIADFKNLKDFDILILGPYSYAVGQPGDDITDWVSQGGKLLCFEQNALPESIPLGVMNTGGDFGHFTELILPEHPLFKGLCQSDFKYWNGNENTVRNKWLFHYAVLPLHEGVLACQPIMGYRVGMDVGEFKIGKGLCLLSQLEAVKRFRTDSVATKYLLNMFNYAFGAWDGKFAVALEESGEKVETVSIPDDKAVCIDLRRYANMDFTDEKEGDLKGGWTDQGPKYDFRNFPTGKQRFLGVPFDIIKPENNDGKSCIVLQGQAAKSGTDFLPKQVEKIRVGEKVKKLYFLVTAAWVHGESNIGSLQILYNADGTAMFDAQELRLVNGENIADWWNPRVQKLSASRIAWTGVAGKNDSANVEVGCFLIEWNNPSSDRVIEFINFYSNGNAVPILIGITGEK